MEREAFSRAMPRAAMEREAFRRLADVIRGSIDPQSWVRTEGEGGDIEYWAGRAIGIQTRENHEMVESFFRDLRAELKARRAN